MKRFGFSLLACLACFALPIRAQTITATIAGTITDSAGAVVPGATVTATSKETGISRSVVTDGEGRYTIPFLQPGVYDISVEGAGFARQVRQNVRLEVAQTATLDFALSATVQEVVEVSGETTPLLQTETSQLETTIETKLLEDLPTANRNIFNFLPFVPGVIDVGAALGSPDNQVGSAANRNFFDSNFSVNGGRASSNDVLLDGVTNTVGDFQGVAVSPPQDSIREFKIQSGVAPAEFGRTAGGIVNIATRAGTNRFHGSLYEYFQDDKLNANGFFRNKQGLPRIDVNRNQFGGAIGGPVYLPRFGEGGPALWSGKDRTFFFFNYEARREDNPFTRELLTVPTAAERRGDLSDLLDRARVLGFTSSNGTRTEYYFAPGNPSGPAGAPVPFGQIFNPYGPLVPYYVDTITPQGVRTRTVVQGRPAFPNNDLSNLPVCAPGPRTSACLDPVALNVLSYIPLPNSSGTRFVSPVDGQPIPGVINNFIINDTSRFTRDIVAARIDQKISDKQSLFARFSYEKRVDAFPNYFKSPASNARTIRDQFGNFTFNHVYAFSASVINNARYGYTRVRANQRPNGQGFNPTLLGLPTYLLTNAANLQFPDFTIGGGSDGLTPPGQINSSTIGGAGNNQPRDVHTVADAVTIIRSSHTIKAGGEFRLYRFYPFQFFTPVGSFSFDRTWTRGPVATVSFANSAASGSALASFLLGLPSSGNREIVTPLTLYKHYKAAFVQDDWRVKRNLTLNIGLRYELEPGTAEARQLVTNFDFDAPSPLNGRVPAPTDPFVRQLNPNFTNLRGLLSFPKGPQTRANHLFAPRVGFAYGINARTTVRGGYGIFYLPLALENPTAQGTNFTTSLIQSSQTAQVGAGTVFLTDPFPNGLPGPVGNSLGALTRLGDQVYAVEPVRKNSYNQQWNLVVSRQLARNLVLDLAYVGSRGVHLPVQQLNLNQLSSAVLDYALNNYSQPNSCGSLSSAPFTLNIPCASPAAFLNQMVPNPFQGLIPTSPSFNGAFIPRAQLLRPYPQYTAVLWFRPLIGDSKYNAFQVNLQKRFSDGLSAVVNYTWSKLMDTSGVGNGAAFLDPTPVQDVYNYKGGEYSLSTLDIPHRFTATFTYELPFGRKRRFGRNLNRFVDLFLGGYQVSGTVILQSGAPIQIIADSFTGLTTLAGVGNAVRRPDRVGQNGFSREDLRDAARNGRAIFNTGAFASPSAFKFGNAARTYDDIRRDQYRNVDLSLLKNFTWNEGRQKIQLRAEFLNAFNYVVFGTPERNVNSPNFGIVTTQGNRPRIIQLVARYTF